MTNGEKLHSIFPTMRINMMASYVQVMGVNYEFNNLYPLDWWNAEYKESATPNDCETCIHNKGVLECDMYGCKYEPTTKDDKVDCKHTDCKNCVNHKYCDYESNCSEIPTGSTTKKDCNTCTHNNETDGSNCYECVKDMCNNYESTTKNDLGVDCNNCKNNFHRGDGTSYCATGDGMCHYECEEPILDKIRAEILKISSYKGYELGGVKDGYRIAIVNVLNIIDKYQGESEG